MVLMRSISPSVHSTDRITEQERLNIRGVQPALRHIAYTGRLCGIIEHKAIYMYCVSLSSRVILVRYTSDTEDRALFAANFASHFFLSVPCMCREGASDNTRATKPWYDHLPPHFSLWLAEGHRANLFKTCHGHTLHWPHGLDHNESKTVFLAFMINIKAASLISSSSGFPSTSVV